jgi:chromosome segregation ATPase
MKKLLYLPVMLLLFQCSPDPVQQDLLNYINVEMPKVATLESEAVTAYGSISGENYQNDSIMYYTIAETVVPKYEEFYTILKDIKPATAEVASLHKEYVQAAADQLEAFKLILDAIEKQDAQIITTANEDLAEGRALLKMWRADLDSACVKHNVVFNSEGEN